MTQKLAYSIPEFCMSVGISERTFFNLQKRKEAPRVVSIGMRRKVILATTAEQWLLDRQQQEQAA